MEKKQSREVGGAQRQWKRQKKDKLERRKKEKRKERTQYKWTDSEQRDGNSHRESIGKGGVDWVSEKDRRAIHV